MNRTKTRDTVIFPGRSEVKMSETVTFELTFASFQPQNFITLGLLDGVSSRVLSLPQLRVRTSLGDPTTPPRPPGLFDDS